MRTVNAARYVTPLREGGSLPAFIEADDDGMYVPKFRGAGQGTKALIAELIVGEVARVAGLLVPELVFGDDAGSIGELPRQRFHWLVSPRSTVIQTSPVHTGTCNDPAAALDHLVATMSTPPSDVCGNHF